MNWIVSSTTEFDDWFNSLDDIGKEDVLYEVKLLRLFGPELKRPHSDTIVGSKYKNLKELRIKETQHVYRISYIFDKKRKAWLLIAGDKQGKNSKEFYRKLVELSEKIIKKYRIL